MIKRDKIIVFLVALIPRLILIFCFAGIFRTPMDEMSTIATGAYFGGKDWTALTTFAKFYYGGGFTILFAPLFRLISNASVIYYIMLSVCAVLQSISAPISYHIMQKYLHIEERKYLFIGSIACSFIVVTRAMEVFNEHIIIACVWICALLVCRLIDNRDNYKKKAIDSVLLMLIFSYLLTTHARAKVIWIAFAIVVICYLFIYKRWLIAIIPSIAAAAIGYFGATSFNTMVKTVIWKWQEGQFLKNTEVKIKISLSDLKQPVYWEGIFSTIFGQINTVVIFTGGIAVIMVVMLIYLYIKVVGQRFKTKKALTEAGTTAEEKARPFIVTISVLFLLCAGAMIAAQSITWLNKVVVALKDSSYGSNAYGYKAFTYVRYLGPFLGPIFLCGISYIYHKKEDLRKYFVPSVFTIGILQMIWLAFIIPHISRSRVSSEVFTAFGGYDIVKSTNPMNIKVYLMGTVILVILFIICLICYYRKKIIVPVILVTCFMFYEYCYGAIFWDGSYAEQFSSRADAGVAVIQSMEQDETDRELLPDTLYVYDAQKSVQKRMYTYQMNLMNYSIIAGRPNGSSDENIVFASVSEDEKLLAMGYVCGKLDKNEYVYVNSEAYLELFEKYGVTFTGK